MAITVVGSVAYDSVETPSGRYDRKLCGRCKLLFARGKASLLMCA